MGTFERLLGWKLHDLKFAQTIERRDYDIDFASTCN
jgi:hypothetical protein